MTKSQHVYEVRPRKDKRGVELVSDVLPCGWVWYTGPRCSQVLQPLPWIFRNGSPDVRASAYPSALKPRLGHSAIVPPSRVREMRVPGSAWFSISDSYTLGCRGT